MSVCFRRDLRSGARGGAATDFQAGGEDLRLRPALLPSPVTPRSTLEPRPPGRHVGGGPWGRGWRSQRPRERRGRTCRLVSHRKGSRDDSLEGSEGSSVL